jgi:hypothetical protein
VDGFAEPSVKSQMSERHITEFTGDVEAMGAQ